MYLLDTDIISNLLKKSPSTHLIQKLAQIPFDQQFTTTITLGELAYGAYRRPDAEQLMERILTLLEPAQILPFDFESSLTYGETRARLEKEGIVVAEADLRIGAIALTRQMTVVTGNIRHFSLIPDLRLENWLQN